MIRLILFCVLLPFTTLAQPEAKERMAELSFLTGEWVGTSTLYENGEITSQVPAFERISYDLDSSILVIELNSETLKLHTIVRWDDAEGTYHYQAFSERGTGILPAELVDGKMVVNASATKRYLFERTADGGFREYGEKLVDGKWVMYFEDRFVDTE
jgi:hypothetical protein